MAAFLSPIFGAGWQSFTNQGAVLNGGLLYTYVGGSVSTPQVTWTTSTQAVQNPNPITLNSAGRLTQEIWLQSGALYKFVLTDSAGNTIGTWDNISGVNDTTFTQSEWISTGLTPTFINTTTFTVPGNQTAVYTANRRVQASVSAGTVYGYVVSSTFGANTTVVVAIDSGALDSGLTAVNVGLLNATNPSVPQSYIRSGTTIGGALYFGKSVSIAAAATTDLSTATGNEVHITGNGGPITSFGVVPAGAEFTLIFDSNPTVTYNATSLIIPGALSVTVSAGDVWKVVSEGSGNWRVVSISHASGAAKSPTTQTFSTPGTFTYTTPAGLQYADIEVQAAGGGSGGCGATAAGQVACSGGGGGGGYGRIRLTAAQLGVSQSVTVGQGGLAGVAGNNIGGAGGTSSFGSFVTASGGIGGNGGLAAAPPVATIGVSGGTCTGGDINITGGGSGTAVSISTSAFFGAHGGGSFLSQPNADNAGGAGAIGQNYGGGASGKSIGPSLSAIAGAAGANGIIIVREYYNSITS